MIGRGRSTKVDEAKKVSDSSLIWFYLGVTSVPCVINSPLRKDEHPSFGLWSLDGERIFYTDFATKETGSTWALLSKLWCCSYDDVPKRIVKDFKDGNCVSATVRATIPSNIVRAAGIHTDVKVDVKVREWRKYDEEYWNSYGVPIKWLKYADVHPISHKIITKEGKQYLFGADKLAYAFVEFKEGHVTLKIYQPHNKNGFKWASTHDRSVVSLWAKVPEYGDKIIICSSLKDALCLWSNTGIPCLALQGEGYGMSDTAISELKRRYKEIYILFDNDKAGIDDSVKLAKQTGFTRLVLPSFEGGKDVSDLYKVKGKEEFMKIIDSMFTLTEDDLPY